MLVLDELSTVTTLWFVYIFVLLNTWKHTLWISFGITHISRTPTATLAEETFVNLRSRTYFDLILDRMPLSRYQTLQFHLLFGWNNRHMYLCDILRVVLPPVKHLLLHYLLVQILLHQFSLLLHNLFVSMRSQSLKVHVHIVWFDSFFFSLVC